MTEEKSKKVKKVKKLEVKSFDFLKPCPFCGSTNVETCKDIYGYWTVVCYNKECLAGFFNHKWAFEREVDAIEKWNRRVNE